jgi:hypothetical protein
MHIQHTINFAFEFDYKILCVSYNVNISDREKKLKHTMLVPSLGDFYNYFSDSILKFILECIFALIRPFGSAYKLYASI